MISPQVEDSFSLTGTGTNAGVTLTQAASTTGAWCATGLTVVSDTASAVTLQIGGTTRWQTQIQANAPLVVYFGLTPVADAKFTANQAMVLTVATSTSSCKASLQGFGISRV